VGRKTVNNQSINQSINQTAVFVDVDDKEKLSLERKRLAHQKSS
jgi:hypothetical protein